MSVDQSVDNPALGVAGFTYADLHDATRLTALDAAFLGHLEGVDPGLSASFAAYRRGAAFAPLDESTLLIAVADVLGQFIAQLWGCAAQLAATRQGDAELAVLWRCKGDFVGKRLRARRRRDPQATALSAAEQQQMARLEGAVGGASPDPELRAARLAMHLLELLAVVDARPAAPPPQRAAAEAAVDALWERAALPQTVAPGLPRLAHLLDLCERWHLGNMAAAAWSIYHTPAPIDPQHAQLVEQERPHAELPEAQVAPAARRRARQGFALTDRRMGRKEVGAELDYCLLCHSRGRDSCRHGLREAKGPPPRPVRHDPKGVALHGCPLDERISEAHAVRRKGNPIGALAIICIDNPMCAGTGHRICNDCMKACIFQKQQPVDIPQVETGILSEVLALPWGFEIYSLLTRFNPLNRQRPTPQPYRGIDVLVVGLGPAGYTLAHYLAGEGFGVVGIDALKIEPLPADLLGSPSAPPRPVVRLDALLEELDARPVGGFGGVAEYGITVRWDKNFLKILHLNLARRRHLALFGGVRFGGTVTLEDAWSLGFAHVALAAGAGKPTLVPMRHNLLRGMRFASDFLMALQLGGAFKRDSLANLQVELPAVVVGGGLTAIDTATELLAYYPVQVERLLQRVEKLGEAHVLAQCDAEEAAVLHRMLGHAQLLRDEAARPQPDVAARLRDFGGVSVVYRRSLSASPAYRLNHEEVQKALDEGITFVENLSPVGAVRDATGHVDGLVCQRHDHTQLCLPARSVMLAAGTAPNVVYEKECPGSFELDAEGRFFATHRHTGDAAAPLQRSTAADAFFTSYRGPAGQLVTFYGDNHPRYAGNVVKAMASAKHGHRAVLGLFAGAARRPGDFAAQVQRLTALWQPRVHAVNRLGQNIVEVVVHAPSQARRFAPGQFFRLQNFETLAPRRGGQTLLMEGLALTGAWVDTERGLLSMIALEMGASSRLCALLQPGDPLVVMGPTGAPTDIPSGEHVMLCGGGLGNAVLFSVAAAMRARNNRVVYFAAYRRAADLFSRDAIESASDQVIWCTEFGDPIAPQRPVDRGFAGNIVQGMQAYANGALGEVRVPFSAVDRIVAIGSDRMMAAVTRSRRQHFAALLKPGHRAIASVNSPMQCMMKEICAQCMQRHVDPHSGAESFVFSCFNQDQPADHLDWEHLAGRLRQNSAQEKVSDLWLQSRLAQPIP